ncbi:MAG: hypothetical protein IKP41_03080 [Bacteroidaceae bacterium]|nr:hypothetical protein [Bacteroidaceae bacterium]
MRTKETKNALEQELTTKHQELESQRKVREDQLVDLTLGRILSSITSQAQAIETVMELTKGKGQKKVMQIVESEIIRVAKDMLWCPDHSSSRHENQDMNCYVGTHWLSVESPAWKDFVRQCAEKCGLPQEFLIDADFMKKLVYNTAYGFFHSIKSNRPDDEVWLNMPNGTMVIKGDGSVSRHDHRPEDLFYYCLSYNYDPNAECPTWQAFLDRVLPESEAQQVLAEYFCYILMKSHRYSKMLWLYGPGQNGKSTVLNILEALIGSANISCISLSQLTKDQKLRHGIEHKMVNISSENGKNVEPNTLKQLAEGEKVTVEKKYHDARQTDDYGKFVIATNSMPKPEDTIAFYRRMIIMPFLIVIPEKEKDVHLIDKLKQELAGILNWTVSAFPALLKREDFTESELCKNALHQYKAQANSVQVFVEQMCEQSTTTIRGDELFDAYQNYCRYMNFDSDRKVGRNDFYKQLAKLGYLPVPNGNNCKLFHLKLSE